VQEWARKRDLHLSIENNKSLAHSLKNAVDPRDPDFNKVKDHQMHTFDSVDSGGMIPLVAGPGHSADTSHGTGAVLLHRLPEQGPVSPLWLGP